jgi:hypothetical protein
MRMGEWGSMLGKQVIGRNGPLVTETDASPQENADDGQ